MDIYEIHVCFIKQKFISLKAAGLFFGSMKAVGGTTQPEKPANRALFNHTPFKTTS